MKSYVCMRRVREDVIAGEKNAKFALDTVIKLLKKNNVYAREACEGNAECLGKKRNAERRIALIIRVREISEVSENSAR